MKKKHFQLQLNTILISLLGLGLSFESPVYASVSTATGIELVCPADPLSIHLYEDDKTNSPKGNQMVFWSDQAEMDDNQITLQGNVRAEGEKDLVQAEIVHLNRKTDILSSKNSPLIYSTSELVLKSNSAIVHTKTKNGTLYQSQYFVKQMSAQGEAKQTKNDNTNQLVTLNHATYSTCTRGNEAWQFQSKQLKIDRDYGKVFAYHSKFLIKGVPVLYTPYISFPIDKQRHSGFLTPSFGSRTESGLIVRLPYYLNIAPQMDATLTTGLIEQRGILFGSELRYLSDWQRLNLNAEILPHDKTVSKKINRLKADANYLKKSQIAKLAFDQELKKDLNLRTDRWSVKYDQFMSFSPNLNANILFQQVSDANYLENLTDGIGLLSDTHLERRLDVHYQNKIGHLVFRLQDFQILDKDVFDEKPYSKLPQILFTSRHFIERLEYGIESDFTRFRTNDFHTTLRPKNADRLYVKPYIQYNYETISGFIKPKLSLRMMRYEIDYNQDFYPNFVEIKKDKNKQVNYSQITPIFSIDMGLFFEKEYETFSKINQITNNSDQYIQTLEPRFFYLYAPYREQYQIPTFDTDKIELSYSTLFGENLFTGLDRQIDANQLTTALTSRLINSSSGNEILRVSVGQIHFFKQPKILLSPFGEQINKDYKIKRSELITEASTNIGNSIIFSGSLHIEPKFVRTTRKSMNLQYKHDARKIANLGYRSTKKFDTFGQLIDSIDQVDVSGFWQISSKWSLLARYNYSISGEKIKDKETKKEFFVGFEYLDCCVAVRGLVQKTIEYKKNNFSSEFRRSAKINDKVKGYLQVELMSLGNVGHNTQQMFESVIPGYEPLTQAKIKF